MRTVNPESELYENSWAEDLTPSLEVRQKYMYVQCMGHYHATSYYEIMNRSNLHSFLLLYTFDGVGIVEYRKEKKILTKGLSILIDCDLPHSYYTQPGGSWDFYWLHFNGTCIEGYLQEVTTSCNIITLDMNDIFHKIYDYSRETDNISTIIMASTAIIEMCSNILLNIKQNQLSSDHMTSPIIKSSITYMEENMTNKLSLDDICHEFAISKFYYSHLFKAQTGMTPNEYLTNIRLSNAKSLLRSTSLSVADIAENSGFNGSSYFIKYFKKQVGMTPLAYRNHFAMDTSN